MFERIHLQILINRLQEQRQFIQVIVGPRQVGKTTLMTQLVEKIGTRYHFISADAVAASNTTWLIQQWEIARLTLQQRELTEFLLIIDEIQKIENWSETVKKLWDEDTRSSNNVKLIILGSSRLMLQKGLTESLAGRFETIYMGHWSLPEMQAAFGWNAEQFAWYGGYPGSASLIADERRWKDYIQHSLIETSVSKDILMLTRIDKPALLKRLFELGCLYSGQIVSFTKILGQLQDAGNTTTLSHYLNLLDTAGLLTGIEKYSGSAIRKRSSIPKFQVHNTALISSQHPASFQEIQSKPDEWGRIVESVAGAHLINSSLTRGFTVHYWREGNDEVDFVLEKEGKIVAIEVKSSMASNTGGMKSFQKKYDPDKILLIGAGGLPWQEFLLLDPETLF
ncbi:archaeal ATPase [mine drainage metagenome]|uniref:Archaeal ATPase n=1 Tax=mine drainage metagenome TaxID=410659 RepID=A0A1J5SF07_9ZZZZ